MPVKTAKKAEENTELVISLEGKVLDSNFDEFCTKLKARIAELNRELKTDSDFDAADKDAKFLKAAEKSLEQAKADALEQAEEVQKLFAAIDDISESARESRLKLEKQIKKRKDERKREIIDTAVESVDCARKNKFRDRITGALKGRSNFERMEWAAENEAKEIQKEIDASRKVIAAHRNAHGELLLHDTYDLEIKPSEEVAVELERRLERKRVDDEAKRQREEAERQKRDREAAEAKQTAPEQNDIPPHNEIERGAATQPQAQNTAPVSGARPRQAATTGRAEAGEELSPKGELVAFKRTLMDALAPVKAARAALQHPENIKKAGEFAQALNTAYKAL